MKKIVLSVLLLFSAVVFSQEKKISLELNYPYPADNNFIGNNYKGIIDVGAKYRFYALEPINIGIAVNGSILNYKPEKGQTQLGVTDFKITNYVIQPKVFVELNLDKTPNFHPFVGLGYTFMIFQADGFNQGFDISGNTQNQSGFNLNVGLTFDITETFFIQGQYDFTKINVDNSIPNITYNTNVNLIKVGVGIRI